MDRQGRCRRTWIAGAGLALLTTLPLACAAPEQEEVGRRQVAQLAISTAPPAVLNPLSADSSLATERIAQMVLRGAYTVLPDFTYEPDLIAGEATVTRDPFTVTYRLRADAVWSDGRPVSARDLIFTWRTVVDPDFRALSTAGYELIESASVEGDDTVTFRFAEPYAAYRDLFATVLPRHHLEGMDISTIFTDSMPVGSGPFVIEEWDGGATLSLSANAHFPGGGPALDQLSVRFVEDVASQLQLLRSGEIDVLAAEPSPDLVRGLETLESVHWDHRPGAAWEHLAFNVSDPLLARPLVRRAIAHAVDRTAVATTVLGDLAAPSPVLQSVFFLSGQPGYASQFSVYDYDPARAMRLLDKAGCPVTQDTFRACDGDPLTLRYATVAGYDAREATLELVQAQLKEVGIVVRGDVAEPSVLFERLSTGDFDIAGFAWFGAPDPAGMVEVVECSGPLNFMGYCDRSVSRILRGSQAQLDRRERVAAIHQAQALIVDDVPLLPLYQVPAVLAWQDTVTGPAVNPGPEGPLWNVEQWRAVR